MDDPKCGWTIGRIRYGHRYQGLGVICIDCGAREIKSGAVELIATTPHTILWMQMVREPILKFHEDDVKGLASREHLFVATTDGVFERGDDGIFRECVFEKIED